MTNIKVILFDWHNTLSKNVFWENIQETDTDLYNNIRNRIFNENNCNIIKDWMRGKFSSKQFLKKFAKDNKELKFLEDELVKSCESMKFAYENIEETFINLKSKGIKLGIASDNMDTFKKYTAPKLKLNKYFDNILSSNEIGYLKTDLINNEPIFFNEFLKSNNYSYNDCLFIDDSEKTTNLYKQKNMNVERIKDTCNIVNIIKKYIEF